MKRDRRFFRFLHDALQRKFLGGAVTIMLVLTCTALQAESVPSSVRSASIVAKVQPDLRREMRSMGTHYGAPIFIRIFKEEGELELWVRVSEVFEHYKTYYVCDSSGKQGPKEHSGDGKSPEGFYSVTPDQMNPKSSFHLAFDIGYPNSYDLAHGRTGNKVMVHGGCYSEGCFAMTDKKIEEIYAMVDGAFRNGQTQVQVHIFPFRMTRENMARAQDSKWFLFWWNLKKGYDFFEKEKRLPHVSLRENRYAFE
jgi:murein L,D-transpeptidase YafK